MSQKESEKKDHIDRFAEVAKGLGLDKEISNKIANFVHYEVMSAKANREKEIAEEVEKMKRDRGYEYRDHTHCPEKDSPCGIEGSHRCCLCGSLQKENCKKCEGSGIISVPPKDWRYGDYEVAYCPHLSLQKESEWDGHLASLAS